MAAGKKTGGRTAGTPNKTTEQLKTFLDGVFREVFASAAFRRRLVNQIVTLKVDRALLTTLLQYYAGRPTVAVDHSHTGTLSLAHLIVGEVPAEDVEDEEPDADEEPEE